MKTLVIGGHSREIGKTSLVVDLIGAFPDAAWTAVKITQYGHGVCSINGADCGCAPAEHPFSLDEDRDLSNRTDTSRFLVAGAARALWLRTKQGRLAEAMPIFREALRGAGNVIIESNSLLQLLRPDLYLVVLDAAQPDFKDSARRFLDLADACVLRSPLDHSPRASSDWPAALRRLIEPKPLFSQPLGAPLPAPLVAFVRARFFASHPAPAV